MIQTKDISVVVQGPVGKETSECLLQLRRLMPDCEIILSTWPNEKTENLIYDTLVISEDPGATIENRKKGKVNNLNRQLRSTKAGLQVVTRQYVLKLRSDAYLNHLGFLELFNKYPLFDEKFRIFQSKIIACTLFSRLKYKGKAIPFHLSDWAYFGTRTDIEKFLMETNEVLEPGFSEYFLGQENSSTFKASTARYTPEQYLTYACFKRYFDMAFEDNARITKEILEVSRRFIVSNFIVGSTRDFGITVHKYRESFDERLTGKDFFELYNGYVYETEYRIWCDPTFIVSHPAEMYHEKRNYYTTLFAIKKHRTKITTKNLCRSVVEMVIISALLVRLVFDAFR